MMRFLPGIPHRFPLMIVLALLSEFAVFCGLARAAGSDQPQPPQFRLPSFAAPHRYSVNLAVKPDHDTFTGVIDIDLNFKEASPVLWLNAERIAVSEAYLTVGGQTLTAKVIPKPKDLVGFSFDHEVGPGQAKLHVSYEGQISRKDMAGIFQVKDGERWYIYSQFEDISARRAFPCFDEPGYKVPWQVTLTVPKEDGAFSNTPVLSESLNPDGSKTVKFAETKPLPSYLVAIAVGPMDIVDGGHTSGNNTVIRIIVPHGRGPEAKYATETTPDVVNLLEKYFGIPYPYEKLDEVAIPLAGYAMEHPGLVTYGAGFFLAKPEELTLGRKHSIVGVEAHELAHQWFGDLVTTEWWDDIWLNEGFASWMGNKIVNEYQPEWQANISELNSRQGAMETDELVSSRKVRQPILSNDDIANAFDGITYSKGSALLGMFESYLGPERFQAGIRRYLRKYSWGNATSADFLGALAGDDPGIAKAFSTFLDQPGVPLVAAKLECDAAGSRLQLSQQRFLPRGSQGSVDQLWNIPLCVKYPAEGKDVRQCTLMTSKVATISLSKANGCPAWTYDNADEAGYYRVLYDDSMLGTVLKDEKTLTLPERVGLVGDIAALTKGYMPLGKAMALMPKFAHEPGQQIVTKTLSIVGGLDDHLVPDSLKPKYRHYLSDLYKQRAEQLGWKDRTDDDDDSRLLRPRLFAVVANQAEDPEFITQARKLALAWLGDHNAVDRDMLGVVLSSAARHGDRALFDRLRAQAAKETNEELQRTLLGAMGLFRDPAILKAALPIILSDEFDSRRSINILFSATQWPGTRDTTYSFVKQNWDQLMTKLPTDWGAFFPSVAGNYCDEQHRNDAETFFKDRSTKYKGGPRILAQVLESISLCAANKSANQASVVDFLKNY